jgi:hypothetical protein
MKGVLLVVMLLGSCVRTPPVEGGQTCKSCPVEDAPCIPKPEGKGSYIGNDPRFSVCIKADPANTDATCAPYEQELRDRAFKRVLQVCIDDHEVECEKRTCEDTCRNTAVLTDGGGVFLLTDAVECAKTEHACRLEGTTWRCDCTCQLEL